MLIPLKTLQKEFGMASSGVIQIGASKGQEIIQFINAGIEHIVLIEPIPEVYEELYKEADKYRDRANIVCIKECVSDTTGQVVKFNIANNEGQSSSILEFKTHAIEHPDVKFIDSIEVTTITLTDLLVKYGLDYHKYDWLTLDCQGAEGLILLGTSDEILNWLEYIYLEVNEKELYAGCMLLPDIDKLLSRYGFDRKKTVITDHSWGDAYYAKA